MITLEGLRETFNEIMNQYRNAPELEGHRILETIPIEDGMKIKVLSNNGHQYVVTIAGNNISCNCQGYIHYRRCKHILFVIQQLLDGNIQLPNEMPNEPQDMLISIKDYIRGYSHRTVDIPIQGEGYGLEVEFKLKDNYRESLKIGNRDLKRLLSQGLILERDSSVDVEMKSPILGVPRVWYWINNPYWKLSKDFQDRSFHEQGIHVHVNMDPFFDTDKQASISTCEFLHSLAEKVENNFDFRKVFLRRPNQYCGLTSNANWNNRYCWANITNLRRYVGKTLEIRGFLSRPERLPEILFKAKCIGNLFVRTFLAWRKDGRPSPDEWFNSRKILRLLPEKELKNTLYALHLREMPQRGMELFENEISKPLEVYSLALQ